MFTSRLPNRHHLQNGPNAQAWFLALALAQLRLAGSAPPRTHLARGGKPSAPHLQAAPDHGGHVAVVRHHRIDNCRVLQGARPAE